MHLKHAFIPCAVDFDCDDIFDNDDNCPRVGNPEQKDTDADEAGDVCDNCPDISNSNQEDADDDGAGDVCDNCPSLYNTDQSDLDEDGMGDVCDDDLDGDEILNDEDNCSKLFNPDQEDSDRDGFGNVCDNENSFVVVDTAENKVVAFDDSRNFLYETSFNNLGMVLFATASINGWLVKGCPLSYCSTDNWVVWDLTPDLSIRNTISGLGPGPTVAGLTSGNLVSGNVYSGIVDLYNTSGAIIKSTNVWEEEDGWPYDYTNSGPIASLANGGFVIPPEGGYYGRGGGLYTPYLYFYDNELNLINKVDITSEQLHLFVLAGLSDGGFVGTCADSGPNDYVEYLCFFNSDGELVDKIDIRGDTPGASHYESITISGLQDGGVMLSKLGADRVWIYHSPPEELDLSDSGITSISSVAGNIFSSAYILHLITGTVRDLISWNPIGGALISTNGGGLSMSNLDGKYDLHQIPGTWTMEAQASGYVSFFDVISLGEEDQIVGMDIMMIPIDSSTTTIPPSGCKTNADCDDQLFCNGIEMCVGGMCSSGIHIPCPDDGLFCNGEENCNEENDSCLSPGNPCAGNLTCNEENDVCEGCLQDADCYDGLFCTGVETCVDGICHQGTDRCLDDGLFCNGVELCDEENNMCLQTGNPCSESTPVCDEAEDVCTIAEAPLPTILLQPDFCYQSRWVPLLMFLRIEGSDTHFDASSIVTFNPESALMALPLVVDEESILIIGLLMPSWLTGPLNSLDVTVNTGSEEAYESLNIEPLPFTLDDVREMLEGATP